MKKVFFLAILLPFAACKKNSSAPPPPPPPDITESLNVSIVTQNPDKYDSARGHVSDSFSWSIPHAYGDTCIIVNNGNFVLPPNATTLMLEFLEDNYGIGNAAIGQSWIAVNNGPDLSTVGLLIGLPSDTTGSTLGSQIAGFAGGSASFADTIPLRRTYGTGLARMLNWWRGDAIPINDTVIKFVNINANPLSLIAQDTIMLTSRRYIGDELVVSGTFSEQLFTGLAFPYSGSYCRKTWYLRGSFSNLIYVFKPD